MLPRHAISDADWDRIKDFLPGQPGQHGGVAADNRRFIDAVLWVARTGAAWADLPERLGNGNSQWRRFDRWARQGRWDPILAALRDPDLDILLLDSTVVFWGGEMGRLPVIQNEKNIGRDHNTYGFSVWLAGGGIKGGHVHGATDEFGHKAVEGVVTHSDYHATLLHLFGLDPKKLVYLRNGQEQTLTDGQPCRVVHEILR